MRFLPAVYIVLLIIPAVMRLADKVATDTGGLTSRYGPLLVSILLALGFVGYVRKIPMLNRMFWRCLFWLIGFLMLILVAFALLMLAPARAVELILMVSVTLPALVGIYQYSAKTNRMWLSAKNVGE